ncbi:MAG: response regulator [Clostridia bacterium]|nr:response regulator [Clostridia bacterium]
MLKLAIVEDELFMREFLEGCIDYKELGLEICGSFCCAEDALENLRHNKVDLVVTDIVMPGMNGIEFMSELLRFNKDTHFIVISNYQDFELVRKAFRIGICDYIPKTEFETEHYRKVISTFVEQEFSKQQLQRDENIQKEKNLKEIFWGEIQVAEEKNISENFLECKLLFALIDILNLERIVKDEWNMDKDFLKNSISNYLDQAFSEFKHIEYFFNEPDKIIMLFSVSDIVAIKQILYKTKTVLEQKFGLRIYVYLDNTYTLLRNLRSRYKEIYNLRKYRFFCSESEIITFKIAERFQDSFDYKKEFSDIENCFQKKEFNTIIKKLDAMKDVYPENDVIETVLFFYRHIYLLVTDYAKSSDIVLDEGLSFGEIMECYNYEVAIELLKKYVRTISGSLLFPDKRLAEQLDEYVQQHYAEELTLEMIAKNFQYEYGYFSRMFRKLKGVTFKKYLNSVRLEKAMQLIMTSSLKYSEIATAVGYRNYEHFSRLFCEQYGCSPSKIERMRTDE